MLLGRRQYCCRGRSWGNSRSNGLGVGGKWFKLIYKHGRIAAVQHCRGTGEIADSSFQPATGCIIKTHGSGQRRGAVVAIQMWQ